MRILPRIVIPRFKLRRKNIRRRIRNVSVGTVAVVIEGLLFAVILLVLFRGGQGNFINSLGHRADVFATLFLLGCVALFHRFVTRRIIPRIEEYLSPKPYEERRILLSLGQAMRTAASIDQMYESIVGQIARTLEADDASIFVLDQAGGDYFCAASSSQPFVPQTNREGQSQSNQPVPVKLSGDAFVIKRLNNLSTPLVIDRAEIEAWSRALQRGPAHLRSSRQMEQGTLRTLKSHLLVQIRTKEQMVGVLSLGLRRGQFGYSNQDRETMISIAGQLALVIENSRMAERIVIQELLNRELMLAAEVQRRLLPTRAPDHISLQLAGFCEPARGVGGDYYDFIAVDKNRVGIAIADVAGKGMPAALLMSTVQATLRSLTAGSDGSSQSSETSLAQTVGTLNRLIFNSTSGQHYVTFFYAHFDHSSRCLTYVNAGHNPPLYLQSDISKAFKRLTAGGLVAGAFEKIAYDQETLQMQPDDLLFLYTDGLTEAINKAGEEFGEARLEETLVACARLPVTEIRDQIVRRVKDWSIGMPLYDDLTFVVMKVN